MSTQMLGRFAKLRSFVGALIAECLRACSRLCSCCLPAGLSPLVVAVVIAAVLIIVTGLVIFSICLARLLTIPGALLFNVGLLWLLLRLAVRALVFPGSIVLWKRSTEASYRVEMAKQFAYHLEHLHAFLLQATRQTKAASPLPGVTVEGVLLGCTVVEGLSRNFRMQQRDQVRLTTEQAHVKLLVQGIEAWILEAKVRKRAGGGRGAFFGGAGVASGAAVPLLDWMQNISRSGMTVPLNCALAGAELAAGDESSTCIERLEQLLAILEGLHVPIDSCFSNARRFLRVPTVGSLHQLRAELQVRYGGQHYWVRTSGGQKIDSMLFTCKGAEGALVPDGEEAASKEEVPLKDVTENHFAGPCILWCNPNAGYYETMVYESHWLDFYLSQGCNVFAFNYSGFGRSTGHPTPAALANTGDAIIEFLRLRGVTQIGVHGRSIGGIVACHLASKHPDLVKLLIADRTFSTLALVAKFLMGSWAVKGLSISATWAENTASYYKAKCYKVMIHDPKDAVILDLSSLRSAVAAKALEHTLQADRLVMEDERLQRLADAWAFLERLLGVCDGDGDEACSEGGCSSRRRCDEVSEAKRPARQPTIGNPTTDADACLEAGEEDTQRLVASRPRGEAREGVVNAQWLQANMDIAGTTIGPHCDAIRSALDLVGTQFNAGGMTLDEVLSRGSDEPLFALRLFLCNLQVWGSLGSLREPSCPGTDKDIELFLTKSADQHGGPELLRRNEQCAASLSPEKLATYHRQLSRTLVAQVRRDFRQRLSNIRRALEPLAHDNGSPSSRLCSTVLLHLREVETFISSVYRFFKCVDLTSDARSGSSSCTVLGAGMCTEAGDSSEEAGTAGESSGLPARPPRPVLDRAGIGYFVCVDCGHNGFLSEGELQHLTLHLRAANFGRYGESDERGLP